MRLSDMDMSVAQAGDLPMMVAINEDIKTIMRISREINLAAINAMLIAKKIGTSTNGFNVVSAELRMFSSRLGDAMQVLQQDISVLVAEAAGLVRLHKAMALQRATQDGSPHYRHWDEMLRRKATAFERNCAAVWGSRERLARAVGRANKLCVMGVSLSYSAKVEAVYGAAQAQALRQVSSDVEASIGDILRTLGKLQKQLEAV
jgi:hypothetical protein